jgi:O-antigen ligase
MDKNIYRIFLITLIGILIQGLFVMGGNYTNIGLIVFIISMVIINKNDLILLIFFLIPNQRLLVINDSNVSLLNISFLLLLPFVIKRNTVKLNSLIFSSFLLILFGILVSLINDSFNELILIVKLLIVVFVLIGEIRNASLIKFKNLILSFIFGSFTLIFLSILTLNDYTERFEGGEFNEPNYVGSICAFNLALILIIYEQINLRKSVSILISIFLILGGLLTQSRSFVLSLVILFVVFILMNLKKQLIKSTLLILLFFVFVSKYVIDFYNKNFLLQAISERILNPKGDDVSGGRIGLYNDYYLLITKDLKSLFLGIGSNAYEKYNLDQVAHNSILEDIVSFGIVGTIIIYVFIFKSFKSVIKGKTIFISIIPLFIFLLSSMTLHSFLGMGGLVTLSLGVIVIQYKNMVKS